ncbi:DUF551 domain-containing protein [Klebsiella quasipneumoniae]
MAKPTITREQATDKEIQMLIDSHENGTAMFMRTDAYYFMAKELQERRKADSEPYGFTDGDRRGMIYEPQYANRLKEPLPVYRHAQQPVVPLPDVVSVLLNHLEDVLPDDAFNLIDVKAWNAVSMLTCPDACRAAMLQELQKSAGAEATCRSNENVQVLTTINPAQSDCCPAQNHVSPEQNGDTPAQSQGWIPVSERIPIPGVDVLVAKEFFGPGDWRRKVGHVRHEDSGWNIYGASWTPTHWMPLPAAPQEMKDE